MRRVVVIGTTGSGKTSVARKLAGRLGYPHVELDALFWGPQWTEAPVDVFRARVIQTLEGEWWVADGNYSIVRDIVWGRADTLLWLDFSLWLSLWRLLLRNIDRILHQRELWHGNRESFRTQFLSRQSLFIWAVQSHGRHRRRYSELLTEPQYAHLQVIRLRTPKELQEWFLEGEQCVSRF